MKKIIILLVVFMLALVVQCYAGIIDDGIGYVKDQQTQTGIYYSFDDQRTHAYVARTLAQDVFVEKLDLALAWDLKDAIGLEATYTLKEGTVEPYVGAILGTNRIEKIDDRELGQGFFAVSGGLKF